MTDNRILRSPDVSDNTFTLTSDYLDDPGNVGISEVLSNVGSTDAVNIGPLAEINLQALSENLEAQEVELKSKKNDLKLSYEKLEKKEKAYRDKIYSDLKLEISNEIKSEYEARKQQLTDLIESITSTVNLGIESAEEEIIEIVFESVCKIIGDQMKNSECVISVTREVIKHSQDRLEMVLRVSTKDFELLKKNRSLVSAGVNNRIEIVVDEHVRYGGCIVETAAGRIDGRLEQQLNNLLQLLNNGRNQG